ncbi:MAG: type I-B CRISPR-associated protein Cas7/Csh2 [Campylobacteraceae bacterium]|nr:type I-B CRISPR-associated protein Cas7/Csh2 [Campylobacteraceae bacterium]
MSTAKRKEILFLWDGENWNPNGDILTGNAPRYDTDAQLALVTDVRVKRTIRDFIDLRDKNPKNRIFIKTYMDEDGKYFLDAKSAIKREIPDIEKKKKDEIKQIVKDNFIDIRAFGAVIPIQDKGSKKAAAKDEEKTEKDDSSTGESLTGAVQFKMSKSIHKVTPVELQGSGAFASSYDEKDTKKQKSNKTFREETYLPYAMFATYGIVDAFNAKANDFTEDDFVVIRDALWKGTQNLITRSKIGQKSRLLLVIEHDDDAGLVGDLNNLLTISETIEDRARNISDLELGFDKLIDKINGVKSALNVNYICDDEFFSQYSTKFPNTWKRILL